MEGFFKTVEEMLNSGDPEVQSWFLVRNNYMPFILCGSYAIFSSVIGPAIMKNRKPFDLRRPMIVFNFAIVATYVVVLSLAFWNFTKITWNQFCKGMDVKIGETSYTLATCGWVLYIVKYVEFCDTVFFVLRKKQNLISFLHVMHHTIVPMFGWLIFRTERSGFQSVPVIANGIVHIIMYTYYGLAAMGPKWRKYLWWKKYLTQLQIFQFIFAMVFVGVITPHSGCSMVYSSYLLDIILSNIFLYLFYRYYQTNFSTKNSSATNGAVKKEFLNTNGTLRNGEANRGIVTNGKLKKEK